MMQLLGEVVKLNRELRVDTEIEDQPEMLNTALERCAQTVTHDALVIVISDFFGVDDESRRLLTRMAQHNDVLCALLYDPVKTTMPDVGRLLVSRGEVQLELDTGRRREMQDLGQYFSADLAEIKNILARVGVPVLLIETETDPVDQIRHQLGAAVAGRRR